MCCVLLCIKFPKDRNSVVLLIKGMEVDTSIMMEKKKKKSLGVSQSAVGLQLTFCICSVNLGKLFAFAVLGFLYFELSFGT